MKEGKNKIRVFDYKNYRAFLRDWYTNEKTSRSTFSFRSFARKAGFKTSNFLMLVMNGKRNLTESSLNKFIIGLGLNKQDSEFFRNLIFFNQAKTNEEKDIYYQRMLLSKKYKKIKPIEGKQYEYYSKWYHPVIRELIASKEFDGTFEWLAKNVHPSITTSQAEKSVKLLEGLGFVKKVGANKWKQTDTVISTGPTLKSVIVHNYHKELIKLSMNMMDDDKLKNRDVSAITLGVRRSKMKEVIKKIREFRQEILKLASTEDEPEEVAQLNIQFFPVTKTSKEEEEL